MTFPISLNSNDKVKLWANPYDIESQAMDQIKQIASMDEVYGMRVMPDVHFGKGATVGSVIAMKNALSPAAVGVDIGCGVVAVMTNLKASDLHSLGGLRAQIEKEIPVGFNSHDGHAPSKFLGTKSSNLFKQFSDLKAPMANRESRMISQLGTLGGGNHFIEVCLDEKDNVWLTLHSGSRNIGKEIAEYHIDIAKGLEHNSTYGDMAIFYGGTSEMESYMNDLTWAQSYASASRSVMMQILRDIVSRHFSTNDQKVTFGVEINVHHNYVATEVIDDQLMIVTRKGAIRAGFGELALIPGSMGTGSYVVRGLGSADSFYSASHGAGRKMSRNKAKKTFTTDDLAEQTAGIECRKDQGVVDEIPGAYKDLHGVIEAQADLITPVAHLRTVLCVKG